jgi:hypothetical protein
MISAAGMKTVRTSLELYPPVALVKKDANDQSKYQHAIFGLDVESGFNKSKLILATASGQCFSLDLSSPVPEPGRLVGNVLYGMIQI